MAAWVKRSVLLLRGARRQARVQRTMVVWREAARRSKRHRSAVHAMRARRVRASLYALGNHAAEQKKDRRNAIAAQRHRNAVLLRRAMRAWQRGSSLRWRERVVQEQLIPAIKHHKKMERLAYADAACFSLCQRAFAGWKVALVAHREKGIRATCMARDSRNRRHRSILAAWRAAARRTAQARIALLRVLERMRARTLSTALSHLRAKAAANLGLSLARAQAEGEGTAARLHRAETLARVSEHRRVVLVERLAAAYNALRMSRPAGLSSSFSFSSSSSSSRDVAGMGVAGGRASAPRRGGRRRGSVSRQILDAAYREAVHGGVELRGSGLASEVVANEHVSLGLGGAGGGKGDGSDGATGEQRAVAATSRVPFEGNESAGPEAGSYGALAAGGARRRDPQGGAPTTVSEGRAGAVQRTRRRRRSSILQQLALQGSATGSGLSLLDASG